MKCSPPRAMCRTRSTRPNNAKTCKRIVRYQEGDNAMEYIRLGQSGLKVSRLCLGTMNMGAYQNAGGHSRKHVMDAIDASLTRLGMDYVDIYMLHFFDVNTPVKETMG